ncbi:hypothetical protein ACHAXM_001853, partial [Skeletonema potamos]
MSQTPRTPERNRQQEHPSTPATISQTLRAGAVAVVTAPYTVPRGFLRYLGLITSGDASSDTVIQQLDFGSEGSEANADGATFSRQQAVADQDGAANTRPANPDVVLHSNGAEGAGQRTQHVVHRNGAGGAGQRTTGDILLEGPTTVYDDVESPPSIRLSTMDGPDRISPIDMFPQLFETGRRSAAASASDGGTPSDFRDLLAAMEKLHDLVQMLIKNYALL